MTEREAGIEMMFRLLEQSLELERVGFLCDILTLFRYSPEEPEDWDPSLPPPPAGGGSDLLNDHRQYGSSYLLRPRSTTGLQR
jgi:hypothetical protein